MTSVAATVDISKALTIGGWMSEGELLWLATQAQNKKIIVEFGSFHGRSARAIADNMPVSSTLYCVDPWKGDYYMENGSQLMLNTYCMPDFIRNLQDHIDMFRVVPVRQFSYQFSLKHFPANMVFIDGDHRKEVVRKDVKKAYELLEVGGLICGHDYGHPEWPGVKEVVDEMIPNVQIENTIWFQTKH